VILGIRIGHGGTPTRLLFCVAMLAGSGARQLPCKPSG
jgi:hypothetical protein